ncbi:hypothetical protein [Glutamicibacter sp.]|jgi:hypothetical protein|uniref:hypothetical protein n=1 Tax=Glutamicibacter sp. TaxID=1931995 RepID=UPI002B47F766|nr:hypothetical protein [Glutamicibacter sp.]HJX79151.1 hypothetical protein [Glutamicibacter sp.]
MSPTSDNPPVDTDIEPQPNPNADVDAPANPPGPPTENIERKKPKKGELGYIEKVKSARGKGPNVGRAHVDVDSHAMSYFLQGVNCRIAVFENMMISGPLDTDDQKQYDYFLYLRDELESIRDDTLPE